MLSRISTSISPDCRMVKRAGVVVGTYRTLVASPSTAAAIARQYATSKPFQAPVLSWKAKPGMPVSTPQASMPRFLIPSTVGPGTGIASAPSRGRRHQQCPKKPAHPEPHTKPLICAGRILRSWLGPGSSFVSRRRGRGVQGGLQDVRRRHPIHDRRPASAASASASPIRNRFTADDDSRSSHNAAGSPIASDSARAQSRAACAAGPIAAIHRQRPPHHQPAPPPRVRARTPSCRRRLRPTSPAATPHRATRSSAPHRTAPPRSSAPPGPTRSAFDPAPTRARSSTMLNSAIPAVITRPSPLP